MAKKSIEEVANICINEGLGYAIQHYLDSEEIENEELARLWKGASGALNRIEAFLNEHLKEGWDEG